MARRPVLSHVVLAAAIVALAAAVAGAMRLKAFVDTDPRLCAQCHRASPEFALWNKGSHRSVACQKCHHNTPEQGLVMLRAFLAGKPPGGRAGHGQVEVGACAACHLSHDPQWPQVGGSRGHHIHVEEKRISCVTCHAAGMHGFEPAQASCQGCHGEHAIRAPGMQKLHCFACHDFLSKDAGLRPTRRDCLRCHRAEGVLPARFSEHAPMQFACGACHHDGDGPRLLGARGSLHQRRLRGAHRRLRRGARGGRHAVRRRRVLHRERRLQRRSVRRIAA